MLLRLAWKNLVHDPKRTGVALAGVVFAVVLVLAQLGFVLGAARNASGVVDHAPADLWVMGPETSNFDFGRPIPERRYFQVLGFPEVERAERVVLSYARWRTRTGSQRQVLLVGIEPHARLVGPWDLREGDRAALRADGAVVLDYRERGRLGGPAGPVELGELFEINGRRARVVGFTASVGSFTTVPYVFTTIDAAIEFSAELMPGEITYVVARCRPGVRPDAAAAGLRRLPHVEVLTGDEFRDRTRRYWLLGTGLGLGWCLTAALGLVVGTVVVGQTIYATTLERRHEYATLHALGYRTRQLAAIVLGQAGLLGAAGYAIGLAMTVALVRCVTLRSVAIRISPDLALLVLGLTAVLCAAASLSSVRRLRRLEPASVFRA